MDKFRIMPVSEFADWLEGRQCNRKIYLIQNHHTFLPDYKQFKGNNHVSMLKGMENYHVTNNGWSEIAQNFTTFPDGTIAICRDLDKIPAGIKGANKNGICIEHIGNFDASKDNMTDEHKRCILTLNALLCVKFGLLINSEHIVYHHWYDLITGKRLNGKGVTKTCPGTAFIGGNSVEDAEKYFIPQVQKILHP